MSRGLTGNGCPGIVFIVTVRWSDYGNGSLFEFVKVFNLAKLWVYINANFFVKRGYGTSG